MNLTGPHAVTAQFENELCNYTGAKYAVAVNSCTSALLIAVAWHLRNSPYVLSRWSLPWEERVAVEIPRPGYISVPQSIIHAGGRPTFRSEEWSGSYRLRPLPVWDCARRFTTGMYQAGTMQCVSFHASKILGLEQGGAVLHDDDEADLWLRRARFDGRTPGVHPKDDDFTMVGYHCYINPSTAAQGILRLYSLARNNANLPNDDYPYLDKFPIFK